MKVYELLMEKAPPAMSAMAAVIVNFISSNMKDTEEMKNNRGAKYDDSQFYQIRIKPTRKDYKFSDVQADLVKLLKSTKAKKALNISKVEPKDLSPNSGKFSSVSFNIGSAQYDVVIAAGGNKGEAFEKDLLKKLQDAHNNDDIKTSKDAEDALTALGEVDDEITLSNIKSIDARTGSTKRSGDMSPKETGHIIADIINTLKNGQKKYISVKNSERTTIANFVIAKEFNDDLSVDTSSSEWKSWLAPFGLDPKKIEMGLKAYETNKRLPFDPIEHPNKKFAKTSAVYKLLHKLWGSDYIYLRHKGKKFHAMQVNDDYIHSELLKNLTISEIRYPAPGRKQVTVYLTTDGKKYKVELRNSKGAIRPMELKFGLA